MDKLLKNESIRQAIFILYIAAISSWVNLEEIFDSDHAILRKCLFAILFLALGLLRNVCISAALGLFGTIALRILYYNREENEIDLDFYFKYFSKLMILVSILEIVLLRTRIDIGKQFFG